MAATVFDSTFLAEIDGALAGVDAELASRYPGDPGGRQPVHTVYVPADRAAAGTARAWGDEALALLDAHAPDAGTLAAAVGADPALAAEVYPRIRAKLEREPVEDLRIDFEDGYRGTAAEEDAAVASAARWAAASGTPWIGIRHTCLEAAVRARGLRTLDLFVGGLLEAGALPEGLVLTLPKVTYPQQVAAMVRACETLEKAHGLEAGRLRFEIQIETPQSIIGPDGRITVAALIDAAEGRATGLHYGTYDYSAACGVSAAYQAMDHPAADFAKSVLQAAAAGTGVRLSDGSTNVLPVGGRDAVHAAWKLHHGLVRRSLARAYYQGWDMHPGHLVTRYAAVFGFYREGMAAAASRLRVYTGAEEGDGRVMDEPATARALAGYLLRGVDCGAVDAAETGLSRDGLERLTGR